MLSEIERAFQIGFLIFLPFLIIDLVVAAVLMSMGMMMVPPAIVSLPFKLAFFVVADGWTLITGALGPKLLLTTDAGPAISLARQGLGPCLQEPSLPDLRKSPDQRTTNSA